MNNDNNHHRWRNCPSKSHNAARASRNNTRVVSGRRGFGFFLSRRLPFDRRLCATRAPFCLSTCQRQSCNQIGAARRNVIASKHAAQNDFPSEREQSEQMRARRTAHRTGSKEEAKAIVIVARRRCLHHFDGTARQPKRHRPQRA